MAQFHSLNINPPVLNSSCLWASDLAQLRALYDCPHTGAVTTRTTTLHGVIEDVSCTVAFSADRYTTLNSYGYSPHPLSQYLDWIWELLTISPVHPTRATRKPVILSITASNVSDLTLMLREIRAFRARLQESNSTELLIVELNTSCPNIPSTPPPSYHLDTLRPLLSVLSDTVRTDPTFAVGLKLPPYPDATRVRDIVNCLSEYTYADGDGTASPFSFLTCTNTLGNSLLFSDQIHGDLATSSPSFAVPSALGGLGGAQIHPLALGTVLSFSRVLASHADVAMHNIKIIGVGGVVSAAARKRMHAAGAHAVACATLLGREGVKAFEILAES